MQSSSGQRFEGKSCPHTDSTLTETTPRRQREGVRDRRRLYRGRQRALIIISSWIMAISVAIHSSLSLSSKEVYRYTQLAVLPFFHTLQYLLAVLLFLSEFTDCPHYFSFLCPPLSVRDPSSPPPASRKSKDNITGKSLSDCSHRKWKRGRESGYWKEDSLHQARSINILCISQKKW